MPPRPKGEALTAIVLAVFRLNGRLLAAGDALVADLGIGSSQWQVLGALALAAEPLTAPQAAAAMGLTRQGVQKQLDLLAASGLVERRENPAHRRSPLHALSRRGERVYGAAMERQQAWIGALAGAMPTLAQLETAQAVLGAFERALAAEADAP